MRASDADREQVIDTLKVAFTQGRLTKEELDQRAGQAFVSRTYADLAAVTADIPARPADAGPLPEPVRAQARTPDSQAIRRGLGGGAIVVSALIAATALTNSEAIATVTAYVVRVYILFLLIAVGDTVNSRLEHRRARRQLPPGRGGRALEAERDGGVDRNPAPRGVRANQTSTDEVRTDPRSYCSRLDWSHPGMGCAGGRLPVDVRLADVTLVRLFQFGRARRLHVVADRPQLELAIFQCCLLLGKQSQAVQSLYAVAG
jgi:hypothetical protein